MKLKILKRVLTNKDVGKLFRKVITTQYGTNKPQQHLGYYLLLIEVRNQRVAGKPQLRQWFHIFDSEDFSHGGGECCLCPHKEGEPYKEITDLEVLTCYGKEAVDLLNEKRQEIKQTQEIKKALKTHN